jgi:head-tail adaptor
VIRAGSLRNRVAIQAPADPEAVGGQDTFGQVTGAWTDVPSAAPDGLWGANVRFLSGREALVAKQATPEATHAVTMRYGAPATPAHRLVLEDGRVLGVVSAGDPDGRRERLELVCQELVANG